MTRSRVILSVAAVLALGACATPAPATKLTSTVGVLSAPGTSESATAAPDVPSVAKVGQSFVYPDKLSVSVTSLRRFVISSTAAGGKPGEVGVVVAVTITNGSTTPFDASLTAVHLASGVDGDQADTVFDAAINLMGGFDGKVAPGRKGTARYGFAVPKAGLGDLQIEVKPGFARDSTLFAGKV